MTIVEILTTVQAAKLYKTSASSISRAAKKANVGVRREDGRLVGISQRDLKALAKYLRYKAGNPNWRKSGA
jgi:hypothetical protein